MDSLYIPISREEMDAKILEQRERAKAEGIKLLFKIPTRKEIKEKRQKRYEQILDRLDKPKTAKEISIELYELGYTNTTERNTTAPRLTELERFGKVKVIDKKKCDYTGKMVAVYEKVEV